MCVITHEQWADKAELVISQIRETVQQEAAGVTVRLATITCPCGRKRSVVKMYQCLYCKIWMCDPCAKQHFGKTVEQYRVENPVIGEQMNLQETMAEYERLRGWRERWLKLANNKERMRRMGGLQQQMDYVCERSQRANIKIGVLLRKYWAAEEHGKAAQEARPEPRLQALFEHMFEEHGLILLQSELEDIAAAVGGKSSTVAVSQEVTAIARVPAQEAPTPAEIAARLRHTGNRHG